MKIVQKKVNSFLLLSTTLTFTIISLLFTSAYAQDGKTDEATPESPKFIAIQEAQSGSISKINSTTYSLQLNDVADRTILFSERPNRIIVTQSTQDFIGNWSIGADSFGVDPPNAVLVVDEKQEQDSITIELFNPVYDADKKILNYEIRIETPTIISLREFGLSTLIIDTVVDNTAQVGIGMNNSGTF